jgi:SET domain-containing protein
MALLEKHLFVKRSKLPHAGKGLFTKKFIPKGTRIVEYKGRISTWRDMSSNGHSSRYVFYVKRDHVIDAGPYKKAIGRFANDAVGLIKRKGLNNNAYYEQDGLRIFITAKKDIEPGSEILVGYGKGYWQAMRYNNRMDRKEKISRS